MINKLQETILNSQKIVFFTGAGLSTASGIPDFRSNTGLYKTNLKAEEILSYSYFIKHPKEFYDFYKNKMIYEKALPNDAHYFISKLQDLKDVKVVTQNIDNLHSLAGSKIVYELHGSIYRNYCTSCHKFFDLNYIINSKDLPLCDKCNHIIKPDVVLYEEALDDNVVFNAIEAIKEADCLIIL